MADAGLLSLACNADNAKNNSNLKKCALFPLIDSSCPKRSPPRTSLRVFVQLPGSCGCSNMAAPSSSETTITSAFQLKASHLVHSVSPSLAAQYIQKARSHKDQEHDSLALTHCARCGVFLLDGTGSTRIIRYARTKRRPKKAGECSRPPRVLRLTCRMCGHEADVPLEATERTAPEPKQDMVKVSVAPAKVATSLPRSSVVATFPAIESKKPPVSHTLGADVNATSNSYVKPKARPKKPTGLQEMLMRNKKREEQEKQSSSLAAFLGGLS